MRDLLRSLTDPGPDPDTDCRCDPVFDGDALVVDADDCPGSGALEASADCRETVIAALAEQDATVVRTRSAGVERTYEERAAAILVAAGRFAEQVAVHEDDLAARVKRKPLTVAHDAMARAGPVADVVATTGLAVAAEGPGDVETALRPAVAPIPMRSRITVLPPPGASLRTRRDLPTGGTARVYDVDGGGVPRYHVEPVEFGFDPDATRALADAHERLANGSVAGGDRAPGRAVRQVADASLPVERLTAVLEKHTRGTGILDDVFADDAVSDVYATAPVEDQPLRVVRDGETMRSNVRLTADGTNALASRFRRESGRAFSRATPTLDAVTSAGPDEREVRVAGLTAPVSDGVAFAFRAGASERWTLARLVDVGTLTPHAASVLSVATERGVAVLVAGTRGAGKTTMLSCLLRELDRATRTVVIEDTPELPVGALQRAGWDVQAVRTTTGDEPGLSPADALRTALRLGEGALVVGEVRGEEARVLYEAMRVGAGGSAVLGTIHGDGATAVRERVVTDLGVPASSFATTDLVVTLAPVTTDDGTARRVTAVEEVVATDGDATFQSLFELRDDELAPTGLIDRGESRLVERLARPGESYADVLDAVDRRVDRFEASTRTIDFEESTRAATFEERVDGR